MNLQARPGLEEAEGGVRGELLVTGEADTFKNYAVLTTFSTHLMVLASHHFPYICVS